MPAIEINPSTSTETEESVAVPEQSVSVVKEVFEDATPWYKNNAIDTELHPPESLETELSGFPWKGTYYGNLIDKDQQLAPHQPDQLAIYQQYQKIDWMELLIQTPASPSSEDLTQEMSYSLSARLYANGFFEPLQGDLFVANLVDGRAGIFTVSAAPKRLSIFKNAAYDIEMSLYSLVTDNRDIIDNIENKVVSTRVFFKEYLLNGKDPFLTSDSIIDIAKLRKNLSLVEDEYYQEFYNRVKNTLVLPMVKPDTVSDKLEGLYDSEIVEFVSLITARDHQVHLGKLTINGNNTYSATERPCLFDLIKNQSYRISRNFVVKMKPTSANQFVGNPQLGGIHLSDISHYMAPFEDKEGDLIDFSEPFNQMDDNSRPNHYGRWVNYKAPEKVSLASLLGKEAEELTPNPLYYPIKDLKDYYILSENFYNKKADNYSTLESLIVSYLSMDHIDRTSFNLVFDSLETMSREDRYYLTPLIIFLGRTIELSF